MDPLSITAGIAGLATFGTQLVSEVYQFFDGMRDASADVTQTAKDLDGVASILRQLKAAQDVSASYHITFPADTRRDLNGVMKGCEMVFLRLEKLMDKYYDVDSSLRTRIRWNRMGEAEAKKLGGMLSMQKLTLNLTLQLINNLTTSSIARDVKITQTDTRNIILEMQKLRSELTSKSSIPTDPKFTLSRWLDSASTYAGSTLGDSDNDDLERSSVMGTRYSESQDQEILSPEYRVNHVHDNNDHDSYLSLNFEGSEESTPRAKPVSKTSLLTVGSIPTLRREAEPSKSSVISSNVEDRSTIEQYIYHNLANQENERIILRPISKAPENSDEKSLKPPLSSEVSSAEQIKCLEKVNEDKPLEKTQVTLTKHTALPLLELALPLRPKRSAHDKAKSVASVCIAARDSVLRPETFEDSSSLLYAPPVSSDLARSLIDRGSPSSLTILRKPHVKPHSISKQDVRRTGDGSTRRQPSRPLGRKEDVCLAREVYRLMHAGEDESVTTKGTFDQADILEEGGRTRQAARECQYSALPTVTNEENVEYLTSPYRRQSGVILEPRSAKVQNISRPKSKHDDSKHTEKPQAQPSGMISQNSPHTTTQSGSITGIDYADSPKIAPFKPAYPYDVFNDFFKNREWRKKAEVEEHNTLLQRTGITHDEVRTCASERDVPAPKIADHNIQTTVFRFTDPLKLFNDFMNQEIQVFEVEGSNEPNISAIVQPIRNTSSFPGQQQASQELDTKNEKREERSRTEILDQWRALPYAQIASSASPLPLRHHDIRQSSTSFGKPHIKPHSNPKQEMRRSRDESNRGRPPRPLVEDEDVSLAQELYGWMHVGEDESIPAKGSIDQADVLEEVDITSQEALECRYDSIPTVVNEKNIETLTSSYRRRSGVILKPRSFKVQQTSPQRSKYGDSENTKTPQIQPPSMASQNALHTITHRGSPTKIDYSNSPKIAPFIPTYPYDVFNNFFKNREWKKEEKEEQTTTVQPTEETSGDDRPSAISEASGSEVPALKIAQQNIQTNAFRFTDPLKLFNNFMNQETQVFDIEGSDELNTSSIAQPIRNTESLLRHRKHSQVSERRNERRDDRSGSAAETLPWKYNLNEPRAKKPSGNSDQDMAPIHSDDGDHSGKGFWTTEPIYSYHGGRSKTKTKKTPGNSDR